MMLITKMFRRSAV